MSDTPAYASGTHILGDGLAVHRLGFGAMRITGPGVWGPPARPDDARALLRRALDLGIDLIDTADSYGPHVSEDLIAEALHPYPADLVIATKGGLLRTGPNRWAALGKPDYLRQAVEMSLRRLRLDAIPLYQLHRIDPEVPRDDQFGVLADFVREGKVRLIGLSEVSVEDIRAAEAAGLCVATVQNRYSLGHRAHEAVVDHCAAHGIGFLPWYPLDAGKLADHPLLADAARGLGATPGQVALAWLLRRSPVMLPIPGTSSLAHLDENTRAAEIVLPDELYHALDAATRSA
jgi:aryl-alcohol dehydrogenase-like predicted oxidoreductase